MMLVCLPSCDEGKKPAKDAGSPGTAVPKVNSVKVELPETSAVAKALKNAKANGKKAVVYFERDAEGSDEMAAAFKTAQSNCSKDAVFLFVSADDPNETEAAKKYEVDAVDKSIMLVLNGDGLVLKGFTEAPESGGIEGIIISAKIVEFAEAMAAKGVVIVVIGPKDAEDFTEAVTQAEDYVKNLKDMKGFVISVELPTQSEQGFVAAMGVDPEATETVTCVAAKGSPAGKLGGKITAEDIKKIVDKACGPGGCAPGG
jgi:hypothetical protein